MTYQELVSFIVKDLQDDFHYLENIKDFDSFKEYLEWAYDEISDLRNDIEYIIDKKIYLQFPNLRSSQVWIMDSSSVYNSYERHSYRELKKDVMKG
jgi:hypothetical protein